MTILFHVTHSTAFPRGWDYDKDSAPKYMKVKGKMNRCKNEKLTFLFIKQNANRGRPFMQHPKCCDNLICSAYSTV